MIVIFHRNFNDRNQIIFMKYSVKRIKHGFRDRFREELNTIRS